MHNLTAGQYKLRIHKDGFYDPPEQTIAIRKGEEVQVPIALRAIPQVASLILNDLPPGKQVLLDNSPIGAAGSDGRFSSNSVPPGERTVDLHNAPRYRSSVRRIAFHGGDTVELGAADFKLEKVSAVVTLSVTPSGARVSYKCGAEQAVAREITDAFSVTCLEGSFTATASKQGFQDR